MKAPETRARTHASEAHRRRIGGASEAHRRRIGGASGGHRGGGGERVPGRVVAWRPLLAASLSRVRHTADGEDESRDRIGLQRAERVQEES